ncbi:MAG: CapA family protein [Proteobacteria bacterium]|nr:CapA family protein [Pseudomonadota bacterium]
MRWVALLSLTAVGYLGLLWLWNPLVAPGPPEWRSGAARRRAGDVVIVIGGDTAPTDAADPWLRRHGYRYPFAGTAALLRDSDLALVNLESAVGDAPRGWPLYKRYRYRTAPQALAALRWAGIDAVTLANNHALDDGREGLLVTLGLLRQAGLAAIGAGADAAAARRGTIFTLRGTRVGVLAYLEDSLMDSLYWPSFAWGARPGCARLEARHARDDIARLRRAGADVVIVIAHWGRTYADVTAVQRFYAWYLTAAGADLVVGHHPHLPQPLARSHGRPVVFSLGNYAFGTPGRRLLRYGLLLRVVLRERRLQRLELLPLLVQNRQVDFQPRRPAPAEARALLRRLARRSAAYGAPLRVLADRAVLDQR